MNTLPKLSVFLLLMILVSACTPSASPIVAPPTSTVAPTPTRDAAATAAAESNRLATSVAATLTAFPTSTSLPTSAPTETLVPTPTSVPPSATAAPTSTNVVVATRVPPTQVVVATEVPPTKEAASGSVYSFTGGGPQGYTSTLFCTQVGGAACQPTMPPGDLSFAVTLVSSADALEVIFYPFGLSVEKNGANAADMYMTTDAGWLPPDSQARFGTSRTFSQPGHYVIRTNGCLFTQENYASGECTWWTLNGTVVTFDIR